VTARWVDARLDGRWASATTLKMATSLLTCAGEAGRLSKFKRALPERWSMEMVGDYLLDVEGAIGFLTKPALPRSVACVDGP